MRWWRYLEWRRLLSLSVAPRPGRATFWMMGRTQKIKQYDSWVLFSFLFFYRVKLNNNELILYLIDIKFLEKTNETNKLVCLLQLS